MNPRIAKTCSLTAFSTLLIGLTAMPAEAWGNHRQLTQEILGDVAWLSHAEFRQIDVTPYRYAEDDRTPVAPDFQPIYVDRLIGEKTTAREILLRYVDEPDWGMDDDLEVSPFQGLSGGSKAYRHRRDYYLGGVLQLGHAHRRADHFYRMAKLAFSREDAYWGFRFLARALHYLEDMGQPLHARPFLMRQLPAAGFSVTKLKVRSTNYQNYYEAWVDEQLAKQQRAGSGPWLTAIRDANEGPIRSVKDACKALSVYSHQSADQLLKANDQYWPTKVKRMDAIIPIDQRLLDPPQPPEGIATLEAITEKALHVTAKVSKGFLDYAYRDAIRAPRQNDPDAGWGGLGDLD